MMKQYDKLKTAIWIIICLFSFSACEKPDDEDEVFVENTVSLNQSSALPGQILELKAEHGFSETAYLLRIGSEEVLATRTANNTVVFCVPYLPAGDYFIDLKVVGITLGHVPFKIDRYTPVANVDQVYKELIAWMDEEGASSEDIEINNLMKRRFEQELNRLSDADKKAQLFQIKSFLQQVEVEMEAIENSLAATTVARENVLNRAFTTGGGLRSAATTSNADPNSIRYHAARFTAAMVGGALVVGGAVAVIWGSGPLAIVTLPAYAIIAAKALRKMCGIIKESVVEMWGIAAVAVSDALSFNRVGRAATGLDLRANTSNKSGAIVLVKGTPSVMDVSFSFGSVALELEPLVESVFFANLFSAYYKLIQLYTPLYNGQAKMQELIQTNKQILPPPSDFMPSDFARETRSVPAQQIKVENISPAGLNIVTEQGNGGLLFTANSNSISEIVDVSFDVVYSQPEYGISVRRTYAGTYDGREEETHAIVGSWIGRHTKRWGWTWVTKDGVREQSPYQDESSAGNLSFVFKSDRTYTFVDGGGSNLSGNYSVNGNKVIVGGTAYTFSIVGNTLRLIFNQSDAYGEHNSDTTLERQSTAN